jgi:hypothetical protein
MTDFQHAEQLEVRRRDEVYEAGGLRFVVSSNDYGANLAVFGDLGNGSVELIRFQDYVDDPHYHAPVGGRYSFDRSAMGDPLEWWMTQLRERLAELLEASGFADLVVSVDFAAVAASLDRVERAMTECLPPGYERVRGFGVRRIDWSADESAFQKRNEMVIEEGGLRFEIFFDRDLGATMEIQAARDGALIPTIRLDDYEEDPHYHTPVGAWFNFDRAARGEPLAWFVDQVRDHLPELLETSHAGQLIPTLDFESISALADRLYAAMAARVPRGCVRVPGVGLARTA